VKANITGIALIACLASCGVTPNQAATDTKVACTLIQAYHDDKIVDDVCATASDVLALVTDVAVQRADAGTDGGIDAKAAKCKLIPTTKVCATDAETLAAVRRLKASR